MKIHRLYRTNLKSAACGSPRSGKRGRDRRWCQRHSESECISCKLSCARSIRTWIRHMARVLYVVKKLNRCQVPLIKSVTVNSHDAHTCEDSVTSAMTAFEHSWPFTTKTMAAPTEARHCSSSMAPEYDKLLVFAAVTSSWMVSCPERIGAIQSQLFIFRPPNT